MVGRPDAMFLPSGWFRGRTPEKGGTMTSSMSVLTIALLIALLVIDRLAH
jgi:hypothetical protein